MRVHNLISFPIEFSVVNTIITGSCIRTFHSGNSSLSHLILYGKNLIGGGKGGARRAVAPLKFQGSP